MIMDFLDVKKDFDWTIKILNSCKTQNQVSTCDNLFDNFLKKWETELFEERKISYKSIYKKNQQKKLYSLL